MLSQSRSSTDLTRSAILAHIGAQGPSSRADLARGLGVSPALISQLSRELLSGGILVEFETSVSGVGRPAQLLGLDTEAGRAIGVRLVADHVMFVELGIDSTLIRSASDPIDVRSATFLQELVGLLRRFISGRSSTPLLGVGVGVPGDVDEQDSGVVSAPNLGWHQLPLGATLRREIELPVIVENSTNAITVAERLYGVGRHHENFVVLTVGPQIGLGIVLDGMLVRGTSGGAGDIGHIPVAEEGVPCMCGIRGCLEGLVGQAALVARAQSRGVIGIRGTITALGAAAEAGDAGAQGIYSEAGQTLGRVMAGVVQILDPEIVIVLGEATASWNHWSFGFEPSFRSSLSVDRRGVPVAVEPWQDASWAQGAAALILSAPFDTAGVSGDQGRLVRQRILQQSSRGVMENSRLRSE